MNPFGRYLTTLRLNRRMKQKDLAEALDVNPSYISAIESGKKNPPSSRAIREIVRIMQLPKEEEALLWNYADQSIKVIHIPDGLPLATYALIQEFRASLKSLTAGQVSVIRSVLSMDQIETNNIVESDD